MIMKWVKERINMGHVITIVMVVCTAIGSVYATYQTLKVNDTNFRNEIRQLNQKVEDMRGKLEESDKNWDELLQRLDERYVNQESFDNFKVNINRRLTEIRDDTKYLIRLQSND